MYDCRMNRITKQERYCANKYQNRDTVLDEVIFESNDFGSIVTNYFWFRLPDL